MCPLPVSLILRWLGREKSNRKQRILKHYAMDKELYSPK
jgi:hypothetical protein